MLYNWWHCFACLPLIKPKSTVHHRWRDIKITIWRHANLNERGVRKKHAIIYWKNVHPFGYWRQNNAVNCEGTPKWHLFVFNYIDYVSINNECLFQKKFLPNQWWQSCRRHSRFRISFFPDHSYRIPSSSFDTWFIFYYEWMYESVTNIYICYFFSRRSLLVNLFRDTLHFKSSTRTQPRSWANFRRPWADTCPPPEISKTTQRSEKR